MDFELVSREISDLLDLAHNTSDPGERSHLVLVLVLKGARLGERLIKETAETFSAKNEPEKQALLYEHSGNLGMAEQAAWIYNRIGKVQNALWIAKERNLVDLEFALYSQNSLFEEAFWRARDLGRTKEAEEYCHLAINKILQGDDIKRFEKAGDLYTRIGWINEAKAHYDSAIVTHLETVALETGNYSGKTKLVFSDISRLAFKSGKFRLAMAYAEKAGDIYGAACAAKTAGEKEEANRLYSLALVRSLKENDFYGAAIIARDAEFHFADKIAGIEYRNQISKGNFEAAGDFAASYGRKDWAIDAYKQAISYTRGLEYVIVEGKLNEIARLSLKLANLTRAAS